MTEDRGGLDLERSLYPGLFMNLKNEQGSQDFVFGQRVKLFLWGNQIKVGRKDKVELRTYFSEMVKNIYFLRFKIQDIKLDSFSFSSQEKIET